MTAVKQILMTVKGIGVRMKLLVWMKFSLTLANVKKVIQVKLTAYTISDVDHFFANKLELLS